MTPPPVDPRAPVHLKIDSSPEHIEGIRLRLEAMAKAVGFDDRGVGEVGLVVNEALANIIEHAYQFEAGRPIEFWAEPLEPGPGLRIRIRDWGPGIDPSKLPIRPKDPTIPGGLGLICMRELMDSVEYAPQPDGGILLTMTRRPPTPPPSPPPPR